MVDSFVDNFVDNFAGNFVDVYIVVHDVVDFDKLIVIVLHAMVILYPVCSYIQIHQIYFEVAVIVLVSCYFHQLGL